MDTLGAIVGPLSALWLLAVFPGQYRLFFCIYAPAGIDSDGPNWSRRPGKNAERLRGMLRPIDSSW